MKRIVPFFLTFAVGLFIASFFVTIAAPSFQFSNSGWKRNHRQYDRQREIDIQRLRQENMRLKNQLLDMSSNDVDFQNLNFSVPPPPPMPPAPPAPPVVRTVQTVPYQGK